MLATLGVGAFMSTLDGSIVNVSLPEIREALGASIQGAQWVVMSYLLVMSSLLLTFGRLGNLLGHRRVYLVGFLVFGAASFVCAAATGLGMLVAGRAAQAVGAAAIQSVAPALLTEAYPQQQRGRALGLMSLFTYAGLTFGPTLGGLLTTHLGWRSIFFVNIPVAITALAMGSWCLPKKAGRAEARFDLAGAGLWAAGLAALLFGLTLGSRTGFTAPAPLGLVGAALVLIAVFVAVELRREAPMMDLGLFRSGAFSGGVVAAFLNYVAVFAITFLTPFRLIEAAGLSPQQAGLLLTAMPLAMATTAPVAGSLSDRIGTRAPATLGMATLAAGLLLLRHATGQAELVLALALCGVGTGTFISPNTSAVLGAAPGHRRGIASGTVATARTTGMVVGVALAGSVYAAALAAVGGDRFAAYSTALWPAILAALGGALASLFRQGARPTRDQPAPEA